MKKKYIQPDIEVEELSTCKEMLVGSGQVLNQYTPTSGLDNDAPENGGLNDGSHTVGAKGHEGTYSVWDDE